MTLGTIDAVREILAQNPAMSTAELIDALPEHNKYTVRNAAARIRSEGSLPQPAEDMVKVLIADHLAGKSNAEQLSTALHMRSRIDTQRNIFVDIMIRANNIANALASAMTEDELNEAMTEKQAIIALLGGAPVAPPFPPIAPNQTAMN